MEGKIGDERVRFTNVVEIERPVEVVFSYLADLEHIPEWNYAIERTEKVSEGPVGVGTRYRQVRRIPRPGEEGLEVTVFEPDRRLAVSGALGPFAAELDYRVEATDGGTRLTNEVELTPKGILGMVGRLASSRVRQTVAQNLQVLKGLLETGTPQGPSV